MDDLRHAVMAPWIGLLGGSRTLTVPAGCYTVLELARQVLAPEAPESVGDVCELRIDRGDHAEESERLDDVTRPIV